MSKEKASVLVTGAGSGIGAATARLFSENGYPVILAGRRKEALQKVAGSLRGPSRVVPADLNNPEEVTRLVAEANSGDATLGVLINCAGIFERRSFESTPDEVWESLFSTNLLAPVRLIRQLIPHFKRAKGGAIVNVGSVAGLRPMPGVSAYSTIKAALIHLTESTALELAPHGIRVNCVCPGIVDTPIQKIDALEPEMQEQVKRMWSSAHPIGRFGKPEEVAWVIYQLCQPDAGWLTGVVLPVDGGMSLT